jgi:choline kinase
MPFQILSHRLLGAPLQESNPITLQDSSIFGGNTMDALKNKLPPHSSHPNFGHLTLLVLEAVLEVVFISLPGYIAARMGMFNAEQQKFLANLNVMLFTPALS